MGLFNLIDIICNCTCDTYWREDIIAVLKESTVLLTYTFQIDIVLFIDLLLITFRLDLYMEILKYDAVLYC